MDPQCSADPPKSSGQKDANDDSTESNSVPEVGLGQPCSDYWASLFAGDLCCKLWFTATRETKSANHKAFWPHPPTLLYLFGDLKVYGGAQCMGDMVVQNYSQLHWGINLSPGVKAASSNCAGSHFMRICSQCSEGLYCGGEKELLRDAFFTARKNYWARKKGRTWKKNSVCWGYHGCGGIRPWALGLPEGTPARGAACMTKGKSRSGSNATNRRG